MKFLDDSYRLLGLHPGVGPDRVRRAFRRAAKKCHPDVAVTTGSDEFIKLRRAFNLALGYEEGWTQDPYGRDRAEKEGDESQEDITGGSRRGRELDLRLILKLDRAETARELETVINFQRQVPCGHCRGCCPCCGGLGWVMVQGSGFQDGHLVRKPCPLCQGRTPYPCPICHGKGFVEEEIEERLLIPPHLNGSEVLVMPGMGHVSPEKNGDLILNVVVE